MENKSIYFYRKADKHPAVQNLRKFFREYLVMGGSRKAFADGVYLSITQLNQYLTGIYAPRRDTVIKWAEGLGVSYEEMMVAEFDFIPYPFEEMYKTKNSQNRHVSKTQYNMHQEAMINEYMTMVSEGELAYDSKVLDLMERYRL